MFRRVLLGVTLMLFATAAHAEPPKVLEEFKAQVLEVLEGDMVRVRRGDETPVVIRLEGIDAPELAQPFGEKSKEALESLVSKKTVLVKKTGDDKFRRIIGIMFVDQLDVNTKMIETGMAWHFKKYNSDELLAKKETEARTAKVGLWTEKDPLAPWDYRAKPPAEPAKSP